MVGDLELDERTRDDADRVRAAGARGAGHGAHAAHRASAAHQGPAASRQREPDLAREHGVALVDVLARRAEDGDGRHLRPPRAGTTRRAPPPLWLWKPASTRRTASATSSVTWKRSRSFAEILPSGSTVSRNQATSPPQYADPMSTTGNDVTLPRLDEGQRLEQLVERAEARRGRRRRPGRTSRTSSCARRSSGSPRRCRPTRSCPARTAARCRGRRRRRPPRRRRGSRPP